MCVFLLSHSLRTRRSSDERCQSIYSCYAGVLDVSANVNDPDYEGKWSSYLTVYMVEEAIEAEIGGFEVDANYAQDGAGFESD